MFGRKKPEPTLATEGGQFRIVIEASKDGRYLTGRVFDETGKEVHEDDTYHTDDYGIKRMKQACHEWIKAEERRCEVAAKGVLFEEIVGMTRRESLEQNIARLEKELLDLPE